MLRQSFVLVFTVLPPIALRIDGGHGDQRGAMGTLWGFYGFSIALVAQCSKATLFESILKLAKGGAGYKAMNHIVEPQI